MICCTVPAGVRKVADRFRDLCDGRLSSFNNLCALICLFLFDLETLSGLARTCPWSHSVSDLSRAIDGIDANRFMRRLRASILRRYRHKLNDMDFCLAIDDTANPRYGKSIFRCGSWGHSGGLYSGQKIIVLALVDIHSDFALPLAYRFATKKIDPDYKSALDFAFDMIVEAKTSGFGELPVTCDSWFDSKDLMKKVSDLGMTYTCEIKSNRWVRGNPGKNVPWQKPKELFSKLRREKVISRCDRREIISGKKTAKSIASHPIHLKGLSKTLRGVAVYNRKNGVDAFGFYISTDLLMSGARLWELSRARWRIERMFRDLKQNLSFGRLPCGGKAGSDVAVVIPFLILVTLRLDHAELWGIDNAETIGTMLGKIKEAAFEKSFWDVLRAPESSVVKKLKARRSSVRINQKPVDHVAENIWSYAS